EIDTFVPREQIDERHLDSPYYITPNDRVGQEAFAVIREVMRGKGMAALSRVVLGKRERVFMLQPWNKGLTGDDTPLSLRDQGRDRRVRGHPERKPRARYANAGRAK